MAEAKFTVKWTTDLRELRKSFGEFDKLQKRQHKTQDNFRKKEDKHHSEERKRTKELFSFREKQLKKEHSLLEKHHRAQKTMWREQERMTRGSERNYDRTSRKMRDDERRQSRAGGGGAAKQGQHKNKPGQIRGLVMGAAGFLAGGIAGILMGAAFRGYENFNAVHKQLGAGIGLGSGDLFRNASRSGRGGNLGFNVQERASFEPAMLRQAGYGGAGGIRDLMVAQRATGMEAGEAADAFGTIRQGQGTSGNAESRRKKIQKEFADVQASAIASDLPKALRPEFVAGIAQVMKQHTGNAAGQVSMTGFAKLAAALGRGGPASLQGERGITNLSRFDQGVKGPGGGEEGLALMQRAMGFGRAGGSSYLDTEIQREKGIFGDPKNFEKVMQQIIRESGGDMKEAGLMMKETGLSGSIGQGMEMMQAFQQGGPLDERMASIQKIGEEQKSLEKQAQESMKEANTRLGFIAEKFDFSVRIGSQSAAALDKIEKLQHHFVQFIFEEIPKIVKDIKFLANQFSDFILSFKQGVNNLSPFGKVFDVPDVAKPGAPDPAKTYAEQFKTLKGKKSYFDKAMTGGDAQTLTPEQQEMQKVLSERAAGVRKQYGADIGDQFFKWGADQNVDTIRGTRNSRSALPPELQAAMANADGQRVSPDTTSANAEKHMAAMAKETAEAKEIAKQQLEETKKLNQGGRRSGGKPSDNYHPKAPTAKVGPRAHSDG